MLRDIRVSNLSPARDPMLRFALASTSRPSTVTLRCRWAAGWLGLFATGLANDDPSALSIRGEPTLVEVAKSRALRVITFGSELTAAARVSAPVLTLLPGARVDYERGAAVANQTLEGSITLKGDATFANANDWTHMADMLDLRGPLAAKGTIVIEGPGDGGVRFDGDNSATLLGTIRIDSGRLLVERSGALGARDASVVLRGGRLSIFGGEHEKSLRFERDAAIETGPGIALRGTIELDQGVTAKIDTGGGNHGRFDGTITGRGALRFRGGGATPQLESSPFVLGGERKNDFTGGTTIERGTLALAKPDGVVALSQQIEFVAADNAACLELGANEQVADTTRIVVGGARPAILRLNGHSESVGSLSLDGDLIVRCGPGAESLNFAASSDQRWGERASLVIEGFDAATDRVGFGANATALSPAQLAKIAFRDAPNGERGLRRAKLGSRGELVPDGLVSTAPDLPYAIDDGADRERARLYEIDGLRRLGRVTQGLAPGATISFFGDSITWLNGYVSKIADALASGPNTRAAGIKLRNRAINGGGVKDLRDGSPGAAHAQGTPGDGVDSNAPQAAFAAVLAADHPAVVTILIGINDINFKGTSDDEYAAVLRELIAQATAADARVVLATPLLDGEHPDGTNEDDARIDRFAALARDVARESGATFVDLRGAAIAWLRNRNRSVRLDGTVDFRRDGLLTYDGIHLSEVGNALVAELIADGITRAVAGDGGSDEPPPPPPPPPPRREAPPPSPAAILQSRINVAIDRGALWLLGRQEIDGSWGGHAEGFGGGMTALALYTLIKCDVPKDHPSIRRGLAYLDSIPLPTKTYSTATTLMAWCAIDPKGHAKQIAALVERLLAWQSGGGFAYPDALVDLSNTQYAALGLRAAAIAGFKVPKKAFTGIAKWTLDRQESARSAYGPAGFFYHEGRDATGSMTAAGVSVLTICNEQGGDLPNGALAARDRGVAWLTEHYSVTTNPHPRFRSNRPGETSPENGQHYYYLYGLERVGGLLGITKLGDHDWYREGAAWLVDAQGGGGEWTGDEANCCFALLFLTRATAPVTGGSLPIGLVHGVEEPDVDVWLRAEGDTPLAIHISGFGDRVKRDLCFPGEGDLGPRVVRVTYLQLIGDEEKPLGISTGNPEAPAGVARFTFQHSFDEPGPVRLLARVTLLDPRTSEPIDIESRPLPIPIFGASDATLLSYASAATANLVDPTKVRASASSELDPGRIPSRAVDRLQSTGWRAARDDKAPTLTLAFEKPLRASRIAISPANDTHDPPEAPLRIRKLAVKVNQGTEQVIEVDPNPRRKVVVTLPAAQKITRIVIRIVDTAPESVTPRGIGIDEVELEK